MARSVCTPSVCLTSPPTLIGRLAGGGRVTAAALADSWRVRRGGGRAVDVGVPGPAPSLIAAAVDCRFEIST